MPDEIFKDAVIGWIISKCKIQRDSEKYFIHAAPLAVSYEGILDEDDLNGDLNDEVISVIPASPGTYQVWGVMPDGICEVLGYELPGAYSPDWQELLKEKKSKRGDKNGKMASKV